jgi:hypothetical protein
LLICWTAALAAQSLSTRIEGDQLRIAAPRLRFLAGEALDRLRDGATVKYELQLTAKTDKNGRVLARTLQAFAISYDLWEEKFSVRKLGPSPRTISHLSALAAEAWCLDNTSMPAASLGSSPSFWVRLDYVAVPNEPTAADQTENSGFTLTGLIDIFSRRTRSDQVHGFEEIGPLRLDSLKKK